MEPNSGNSAPESDDAATPAPGPWTIFRAEAVQHRLDGHRGAVLPRFTSPRARIALWALAAIAMVTATAVATVSVPRYTTALVIVTRARVATPADPGGPPSLLVLAAPRYADSLRPGAPLTVQLDRESTTATATIVQAASEPLSPEEVRRRFSLSPAASQIASLSGPAAVAEARIDGLTPAVDGNRFLGTAAKANIETGTQPLLALLAARFTGSGRA